MCDILLTQLTFAATLIIDTQVTEQDIEYLRNTPKDISHIVAKQQPIMIPDSSDESSVGKPLAQVRKAVRKPKQTKSKVGSMVNSYLMPPYLPIVTRYWLNRATQAPP